MMNISKTALAGMAALGLIVSGTAQAASTRAAASLPAAAKVKKLSRTAAPNSAVASDIAAPGVFFLVAGLGLAGWGFYEAVKDNTPDTPGA